MDNASVNSTQSGSKYRVNDIAAGQRNFTEKRIWLTKMDQMDMMGMKMATMFPCHRKL